MKFAVLSLTFVALLLVIQLNDVSTKPVMRVLTKVCDSRQFLRLYQRTCIFYGKRARFSNIRYHGGSFRVQRDTSNSIDVAPAPELARKCCQEGCSTDLIALHCNNFDGKD